MAKINAINNKSEELTIDPVTGDSFVQLDIGGTNEFILGVDDTDDSFRVSSGNALGTTDSIVITAAGEITKPRQPAFHAFLPSNSNNVTGNGAVKIIGSSVALTEVFDIGGDFTTGGIFTAPVTGRYAFFMGVLLTDCNTVSEGEARIAASNRDLNHKFMRPSSALDFGMSGRCMVDMDAADTVSFKVDSYGEGSNRNDIVGTQGDTWMSGYLVC